MKRSNYFKGKCRKVDKLNESLDQSLFESDISIIKGVCVYLALPKLQMAFKQLKHHGTEFKKKIKKRLQEPKILIVITIEMCQCKMNGLRQPF